MIRPLGSLAPSAAAAVLLLLPQLTPGCGPKGDGVVDGDVVVAAGDRGQFVLYDFTEGDVLRGDDGEPLQVDDPSAVEGWDLAFSRWVASTNSGDSQSSDSQSRGALLAIEGSTDDWASLDDYSGRCSQFVAAGEVVNTGSLGCRGEPTVDDGYVADRLDDPDGAGPFPQLPHNPSLSFWFEYDFSTHEVTPFGHVYVVELRDGSCVKLQLGDYYDESGDGGNVAFSWAYLPD